MSSWGQILTVRMGWGGSNNQMKAEGEHADRRNEHDWPSEHKKKKKRVWSTPSYYGNSHLRLTYQLMVVVRTAAKWTRSGSAFGGTWIAPRPSVTFGFSANEPGFARVLWRKTP